MFRTGTLPYQRGLMLPDPATHPTLYAAVIAIVAVLMLARRLMIVRLAVQVAVWGAIALLMLTVLGQRAEFDPYLGRVAAFLKLEDQRVVGDTMRIRMSPDGHFWVRVRIGDTERRMLVDSGATVTAISTRTAAAAGLSVGEGIVPVLLRTANGTVQAQTTTVGELRLGNIVARDLSVVVSPAFGDVNVIGMNFLSKLKSWRVEDNTLILTPHHPQPNNGKSLSHRERDGGAKRRKGEGELKAVPALTTRKSVKEDVHAKPQSREAEKTVFTRRLGDAEGSRPVRHHPPQRPLTWARPATAPTTTQTKISASPRLRANHLLLLHFSSRLRAFA